MNWNGSIDWTELSIQWTLTCGHFLWQGFAVAAVILLLKKILAMRNHKNQLSTNQKQTSNSAAPANFEGQTSASINYALTCGALLSLPACIMLTFGLVHSTRGPILRTTTSAVRSVILRDSVATSATAVEGEQPIANIGNNAPDPRNSNGASARVVKHEPAMRFSNAFSHRAEFLAPSISVAYAIVVLLLLSRMSLHLLGSLKFRSNAQRITDPKLLQLVRTQATRLKLKAVPIVAICMQVSSPVVVGIVRPMILLPPTLLCGLEPTQLAAILSHEMAHIRRYDLLFNLIQRVIEALLFFHPVTWWLSRRVTIERESCCDDIAASYVGRLTYAEALLQMAGICLANHRSRSQALATLAADGGSSTDFGYRIRRLIDAQETPQLSVTKRSLAIFLATIGLMWASLSTLAQSPQTKNEPQVNLSSKDQLVDGIQWSTWGPQNGLLSGARLITPDDGVRPGHPVIVEYRLKNVSAETRKFSCYVRDNWHNITLGAPNHIGEMGIDTAEKHIELTLEPGREYIASSATASIDTRGLSPGDYLVGLGSAFYCPAEDKPGAKYEIPHRGRIPLKIMGEPNATNTKALGKGIHWGEATSGLRLGAKIHGPANIFAVGNVVEADLWIANVSNEPIECSIRLPHPLDGWLFNIENHQGDTIMLERPPMISAFSPQAFFSLRLAPGEIKAITGERIDGQPDAFAGSCAKFEIVSNKEDQSWSDHTIKGRLVTKGGDYSVIYNIMLDRPDVPGLHIELNTGNCPFTVGQPNVDPRTPRVLDESTDKSIHWGEPSGGLRLGIRQSEFARPRSVLRHGENIEYEVWIKNETDKVVRIERDPRDHYGPRLTDNGTINCVGGIMFASFMVPPVELAKAELILQPGQAARRFLELSHSATLRAPGTPRGRYGPEPLDLEPGKYPIYAQLGELKSGVDEVEIIPAARLQLRKASQVTEKKREYAAEDPREAILAWQIGNGEKQEAIFNWDSSVFVDERDFVAAEISPVDGQPDQYAVTLKLLPESASLLARRIKAYSQWDDPDMVVILYDGKPLGALRVTSPIPDHKLIIPLRLPRQQAESIVKNIQAAIALHHVDFKPASNTPPKPEGVMLFGQVKLPKDDWLFRRQVQQLSNQLPRIRTRDFNGDTIDPDDGRLAHLLSWKDVESVKVTVKANDGRDYSKTVKANQEGSFEFNDKLPVGSYQIDASAVLARDDESSGIDVPVADLSAGTQLLRVNLDDAGEKSLVFELNPVSFNGRLRAADTAKRTELLGELTVKGQPVHNAKVILYGGIATRWKIAESTTDERGLYRFENVSGSYIGVQVKHESLVPADGKNWRDITGPKYGTAERLDLALTAGGFIEGRLLDDNKQPRADVPLRIMLSAQGVRRGSSNFVEYATTDASGAFKSEALYPGTYVIEENVAQYPMLGEVNVRAGQTTNFEQP